MERINFREVGDIGKLLPKSAQFFRQNFISIVKSSLLIVLIPFAIGTYLTTSSMSALYSGLGANLNDSNQLINTFSMFSKMIPGYFLISVSFMLFYIVCISYIKQYVNGVELIDQKSVLKDVKKHILKVIFGGFLTLIMIYIGTVLCLIPGIYLAIVFSQLFVIAIVEDLGFGKAFSKSFKIIKGKWWESFLLYLVSSLIISGISFIMVLPMYITLFAGMFKNMDSNNPEAMLQNMGSMAWFVPLYMLVYLVITMIMAIIQSANYYNLVEAQEGLGEKSDIENIGN